jgi:hypothetical protein
MKCSDIDGETGVPRPSDFLTMIPTVSEITTTHVGADASSAQSSEARQRVC